MKCESCHSFGEVEAGYFEEQAAEMMDKLKGEEDLTFSIIAIDDETQCEDAYEEIPVENRDEFLETCRGTETSVSFRAGGQEFIIIKTDKQFLFEDPAALRGLLAHELMHTVQRDQELGQKIEEGAKRYEDQMLQHLQEAGLSDQEINRFIHTVFQTAIYTLKDLFTNAALLEQGFAPELQAYYHHMLGVETFCPAPAFYGEADEAKEIEDAITFELGLLPAWLPFQPPGRDGHVEIRERIEECYEEELPRITAYIEHLEDVYQETYDEPEQFIDAFFEHTVKHAIELMESAGE